jgi:hypothetical protein
MSLPEKLTRSNFAIKLRNWEYWPFGIVQFPLFFYFGWLSIRARSIVFFSASNPGITMGGMFGESKYEVLKKVPAAFVPKTIFIPRASQFKHVLSQLEKAGIGWPLICKPDLGERGFMVKRIKDESSLAQYLQTMKYDFIAQELVPGPLEFGVFYTRFPRKEKGTVTSIVMKEMLSVVGDGKSTLRQLILRVDRAKLQWEKLNHSYSEQLDTIPVQGHKIELVSIGNHCLGTKFLDGTHLITTELSDTFDRISKQIPGFYFGRFDLRCASVDDLYKGNIKIMELNGCGAEPAHIYHPGYSLRKALKVLFTHWKNIFIIARENQRNGVNFISFKEAVQHYRKFKAATTT